ncbi:MAG: tRNA (adenosine(37)-N6)-threonylcarbamoyltransferase complex dimerization subunit type 1 TsaB [Candidatus Desulforudis sp.]|nr:tRNA (adenosine(37)-N6)-threonylcarbamoyltransferase complex dimerization subunit type 1 TsaB [Desulforudis sp.]
MNVLGIETSGPVCSVGLAGPEGVLAEWTVRGQKIHSVRVLPLIEGVLDEAGLLMPELAGVAVTSGPGSFTGLRIGLTVAKTLAQVLNIPVAGIPSLEALAYPLCGAGSVWVLVPARKDEVYAALYDCRGEYPVEVFPPASLDVDRLLETVCKTKEPACFIGEAAEIYGDLLRRELGDRARLGPPALNYPRGAVVAGMGRRRLQDDRGLDALTLVPDYIRPPAAELVWQKKNRG